MTRYLIGFCITAMIACLPAARLASAADITGDPPSETVRVYGSELASRAGIIRVNDRLEAAARDVCRSFNARDLARQVLYRRCVADALERAVRMVHDTRLSAYHRAKTGTARTVAMITESPAVR